MKTDFVAAPFLGEFGWEVAMWAPWLRWVKRDRRHSTFTVLCRPGHGALYKDFANEIVEVEAPGIIRSDCQNAFMQDVGRMARQHYIDLMPSMLGKKVPKNRVYTPLDMTYTWPPKKAPRLILESHYDYSTHEPVKGQVVIHPRWCEDKQPERNWPMEWWCELIERLAPKKVFTIGSTKGAMAFADAVDMRGADLATVIRTISQCEFGIGPSSGPLHLMNACKRPVFWWSGNEKDVDRYGSAWNPHRVANVQCGTSWQPTVEEVATCISDRS